MHIKGKHNTVANAISKFDFGPVEDVKANWMIFTICCYHYTMHATSAKSPYNHLEQLNMVIANHSKEDVMYPLRVKEIAQAQKDKAVLRKLHKHGKYSSTARGYSTIMQG